MDFKRFRDKYIGKFIDYDGKYGAQCMDLAREWIAEGLQLLEPKPVNGARDLWTSYKYDELFYLNFKQIPNSLTFVPQESDIGIFNWPPYGHIVVCTGNGNIFRFEAFSQNDPHNSPCIIKNYSYRGFLGVFRPRTHIPNIQAIPQYDGIIKKEGGQLWGFKK